MLRRTLLVALALLVTQCTSKPVATPATGGTDPAATASPYQSPYLLPDGKVDYVALERHFGKPNQNLLMNPRATDVERTAAARTVVVASGELHFPVSETWVRSKHPGDTLYCAHCTNGAFLRRIVSTQTRGAWIVVETVPGTLTDVVLRGWLHGEGPLTDRPKPIGLPPPPTGPVSDQPQADSSHGEEKADVPFANVHCGFGAHVDMEAHPHFTGSVVIDTAIDVSAWSGVSVELVKFEVKATPSVTVEGDLEVYNGLSDKQEFADIQKTLTEIQVGPVPVFPTLQLVVEGVASIKAKLNVKPSATVSATFDAGFTYTKADGIRGIWKPNAGISGKEVKVQVGDAAKIGVEAELNLDFLIFDVTGPAIGLACMNGFEVNAQSGALTADYFGLLTGQVGVTLDVMSFHKRQTIWVDPKKSTYPNPPWVIYKPRGMPGSVCQTKDDCAGAIPGCCGGVCVDLSNDTNHCGSCSNQCNSIQMCGCTSDSCRRAVCKVDPSLDPCSTQNNPCDPNATCSNANGMGACTCKDGYSGSGMNGDCTANDPCMTDNGGCDANAACTNDNGMTTCMCSAGYSGDGTAGSCMPDLCLQNNGGCDANASCATADGMVSCTCNPGYTGDGADGNCTPDDPCMVNNGGCDENASCTNDNGAITCTCKPGYSGDGMPGNCMPDPCAMDNGGCDANATCAVDNDQVSCTCNPGYSGDGMPGNCVADDPCMTDNGGCDTNATCTNDNGTPTCACNDGYTGDGTAGNCMCQPDPNTCTDQCVDNCGQPCESGQGQCP